MFYSLNILVDIGLICYTCLKKREQRPVIFSEWRVNICGSCLQYSSLLFMNKVFETTCLPLIVSCSLHIIEILCCKFKRKMFCTPLCSAFLCGGLFPSSFLFLCLLFGCSSCLPTMWTEAVRMMILYFLELPQGFYPSILVRNGHLLSSTSPESPSSSRRLVLKTLSSL